MKLKPLALKGFVATLLILCGQSVLARNNGTCSVAFSATDEGYCTFTPDYLKTSVYKFGLCQTKPNYLNYSDCQFFINSDSAIDVTISEETLFQISNEMTLETGTYQYLVQLWDNKVSFKFIQEFATPQYGADGVAGSFCYTNGADATMVPDVATLRNISCAQTRTLAETSAAPSVETLTYLDGPLDSIVTNVNSISGQWDGYLLSDTTTLATITINTSPNGGTYSSTNANYFFSVMTLNEPVKINEDTDYLYVGVLLKDAMAIGSYAGNSATDILGTWCNGGIQYGSKFACIGGAHIKTLGFKFTNN